jgi:hypothetical protein
MLKARLRATSKNPPQAASDEPIHADRPKNADADLRKRGCDGHGTKKARRGRAFQLPNSSSSKNFSSCLVIDLARARTSRKHLESLRNSSLSRVDTLARALEWQRQLDAGEIESRSAIARRERLTRARVTQIMNRLRDRPRSTQTG